MHHQCAMRNSFKKTMFGARSSLRVFISSTIYSHHSRKICSFSQDHDPGSWESMEGLLRCPANFVPLSPISFLERAAKVCRDRTSLVYGSLEYNWGETHQRCLKLASAITHLGISRGDVVATLSPNVPAMYELHFAVPMAGAILCTLNSRLDAAIVSVLLEHSQAKVLFVDYQLLEIARGALDLLGKKARELPILVLIADNDCTSHIDITSVSYEYESYWLMGIMVLT
uniref:AMP-dependent synthetase/ligase domain-containing protein n=1 Tax=Glycine max TaxID=3847 RepID=C6T1Q4_SOYBN|nr:unknown [Glycine max]